MTKNTILNVLIALSVAIAIIFFLWYLLGNSPTTEQIILTSILPAYLFAFGIYKHLNDKIHNKFEKVNEKLSEIGERLARIETRQAENNK